MQKIVVAWGFDYLGRPGQDITNANTHNEGKSNTTTKGLDPLDKAPASAAYVSGGLQKKLGFKPLPGPRPDMSPANQRAAILADMGRAGQEVAAGGIVVAYFCGHGVQVDGQQFVRTELMDVAAVELLAAFSQAVGEKPASIVLAFDCCRTADISPRLPGVCGCVWRL